MIRTRAVQTNEVRRAGYLYPALHFVSERACDRPLALIDIGTAAGIHLCCDHYAYDYGTAHLYGDDTSPVRIEVELRRGILPDMDRSRLAIGSRIGVDVNPIKPEDTDAIDWLDALIWPEHHDRRTLLREALKVVGQQRHQITFMSGDATTLLSDVLRDIPADQMPCVFQTHIWRQLSREAKGRLENTLSSAGGERELFFISALRQLTITQFRSDGLRKWNLANYEQHGRWLEWLEVVE